MTAQTPERIILDARPRALFADPLSRLADRMELGLHSPHLASTANWRGYVGTWSFRGRRLCLEHVNWPAWPAQEASISDEARQRLFRIAQCEAFPIPALWFSGVLRIATGPGLISGFHGWSSWFVRERVVHLRGGVIVRDREVDTRAMLGWWLHRHPEARARFSPDNPDEVSLEWFDEAADALEDDWWPPDYDAATFLARGEKGAEVSSESKGRT